MSAAGHHGVCENDYMHIAGDPKFQKMLASNSGGNERLIFSIIGVKVNRKGKSQERALVVTNRAIYNTIPSDIRKCQRRIPLDKLHHLTVSNSCDNFVMHIIGEYDYYFNCARLEILGRVMSDALFQLCSRSLRVDAVSVVDLTDYVITKELAKAGKAWRDDFVSRPVSTPFALKSAMQAELVKKTHVTSPDTVDKDSAAKAASRASPISPRLKESDALPARGGGAEKQSIFEQAKMKRSAKDFDMLKVLGKGAFGKVLLVRDKATKAVYAMKMLHKSVILERQQTDHTKSERHTLEEISHPFIVNLRFAFQTPTKLYLVMDYCSGGELFFHLKHSGIFGINRSKLYCAEIASALGQLHSAHIIYRDLKPENILLDAEGHIRLTDFGLAKESMGAGAVTHTFCGTPEYLAPEILLNKGHDKAVDWWSLGILLYEMLFGLPPFYSENLNEMYRGIISAPLTFPTEFPIAQEVIDIIRGFLTRDPQVCF